MFQWPSDPNGWYIECQYPADAPNEIKRNEWDILRRKAGNELYKILEQNRNPAVVEIDGPIVTKESPDLPFVDGLYERSRIQIRITPVQYRDVQYRDVECQRVSMTPYDIPDRMTFWQKLKWLFGHS